MAYGKEEAWSGPAVGLLDLDAFFASVEQLDHPEWRGKPVIVGGDADRRGVVSTASYEARSFGVHSAMPSAQARRLCPNAIWTHGNFERYREVSRQVMDVIGDETPYVEQVSIDEAFFDVTPGRYSKESPVEIARRIQSRVCDLGVTCSIGLSVNKTVSKIASERQKPRGLTVVMPGDEHDFLAPLPLRAMSGIGPSTQRTLEQLGIHTLGELAEADESLLVPFLGSMSAHLIKRAAGLERSPVHERVYREPPKSVSNERTFAQDLTTREEVFGALAFLSSKVARRLRAKGLAGRCVTVKLCKSFGDTHTIQRQLDHAIADETEITKIARSLVGELWSEGQNIRLLGVGVSHFNQDSHEQLSLFDDPELIERRTQQRAALSQTTDDLRRRFGDHAAMYGSELSFRESISTTSSAERPDD